MIVPVYNPGRWVLNLIRSLDRQTLPATDFEVICVDDGSTDGTVALLGELSATRPWLRLIAVEHSGWPSRPRNAGIDAARGEFIFFADHDDELGPEALARVLEAAQEHRSDVVIGREVAVNRRSLDVAMFRRNIATADVLDDDLLELLTIHRLYRTELLRANGIRFPERRGLLEDHVFSIEAYLRAARISVVSDYPVYRWVIHGDGTNSSSGPPDVDGYFANIADSLDAVERLTADSDRRARISLRWLAGTIAPNLGPRLLGRPADWQDEWLRRAGSLVGERFPPEADRHLPATHRLRVAALRRGDHDLVRRVAAEDVDVTTRPAFERCAWSGGTLEVRASATLFRHGSPVEFSRRSGRAYRRLSSDLDGLAPDRLVDVTDDLAAARAEAKVVDAATSVDWYLPGGSSVGLEGDDRRARLVGRSESVLDPSTAAVGRPLEPGVWDYVLRLDGLGFDSRRRLPASAGLALPALVDGQACVAFANEDGGLSVDVGHRARSVVGAARPSPADATVDTTATGSLLRLRLDRIHVRGAADAPAEVLLDGAIHEGSLALPARLVSDGTAARVEGYLSALPGDYPLRVRVLGRQSGRLMRLAVESNGVLAFREFTRPRDEAQAAPTAVPGSAALRRTVRRGRKGIGRVVRRVARAAGMRRLAGLAGKRRR